MSFTKKTDKEISDLSSEDRDKYIKDLEAHKAEEQKTAIGLAVKEALKEYPSKEDITKATDKAIEMVKDSLKKDNISKEMIDEIKESINQLKEQKGGAGQKRIGFKAAIAMVLQEGAEEIKKMRASIKEGTWAKGKELVLQMKAASNIIVADWAQETATPDVFVANQLTEYAEDIRPQAYILPFIDKGSTDKPSIPFMDKIPNQGAMATTAEGALKPLISFSFKINWSNAVKIAGRTKISEEALDDIPNLQAIAQNELVYEHGIDWQEKVFTKINAIAGAFVPGTMAGTTVAPSKYDAIRAAIYGVKIASMGRYIPNLVLINSEDAYAMGATKDKNDNYVLPPWVMPDGTKIAGVMIKEVTDGNATVAAGEFIVGDFRKLKQRTYVPFHIKIGYGLNGSESDFETNMLTMIGESREHFYVYENEEAAFLKDSFTTVMEAIEAAPVV